jgi:hypothetical protein
MAINLLNGNSKPHSIKMTKLAELYEVKSVLKIGWVKLLSLIGNI